VEDRDSIVVEWCIRSRLDGGEAIQTERPKVDESGNIDISSLVYVCGYITLSR
jgi:hypothetical protein